MGQALVAHLVDEGDAVTVVTRSVESARKVIGLGAAAIEGDIGDYASCVKAASGAEVVYHVAGLNEMCPTAPVSLQRVNVEGTRNVARAARAAGVRRLVYTSSAAARESRPTAYGRSKLLGERVAFAEAGEDFEVVAVSPTSVQGPGRSGGTAMLLLAILEGRIRVLPDTSVSIIDIRDCARAHRLAAVVGTPGSGYLVSGATVSTSQISELRQAVGLDAIRVLRLPRWLFGVLTPLAVWRPTLGDLTVCPDLLRAVLSPHVVDGGPAADALGFRYTAFEDTMKSLLEWVQPGAL